MKQFSWCGYEWISQERWGQIRPSHPYQWYDEDCIRVVSGDLVLSARNKEREFELSDGTKVMSKVAIGFASCLERFGYGEFSVDIKLPKGRNLWCAFWMWAFDTEQEPYEYSEIDCVEAYTDRKGRYFRFDWRQPLSWFRLESNLHYDVGQHGNKWHKQSGVVKKFLGLSSRRFTDRFMNYKVIYSPDCIEVYYGGKLVRRETDSDLMKEFGGNPMNAILNYSFSDKVQWSDVEDCTDMVCRNFKYTPM